MLYGHVETIEDRIAHLEMLRDLQDETGGFLAYIPLAYHPDHNELGRTLGREGMATSGFDDLRNLAVGRLFLDNIPHVKTHWPMVTPFLSQIALSFGCDDVEGTVVYERIYHEAGAHTDMHLPYRDLVRLIRGAGKRPVERDSLYAAVRDSFDDPPPEPVLPAATLAEAGELLRALSAPVRIAIVMQLGAGERCVHELVDTLGVAQPLISQHLRVLKSARVVRGERRGREVVYRLADDHLAHIVADAVAHVEEGQ
jgi:DNA-binding transcriptional ArsR family regulator